MFEKACKKSEVREGISKCVKVKGKEIALFNLNGKFFALDNACTHQNAPLSEGTVDGDKITCPLHASQFEIKTGKVSGKPATIDAVSYKVKTEGEDVLIDI